MQTDRRVIIIGLDGVPFGMIKDFADNGVMPNTARLIEDGIFKQSCSTIPEISSVAWSSMITGKNPAQHGIFGFTDLHDGTYDLKFPNYRDLKAKPFWEEWPGKSVIINVPATYPVRPMDGAHISGFVSVDINKSVYPQELIAQLERMDYRLDVDSRLAHSSMDSFMADLDKTLDARIRSYRYLWDNTQWQTFMLVFTGTDRLMHFLFEAYEDKIHKYHNCFVDHFRKIDTAIGEIAQQASDNDLIVMLSDHGFEKLDKDVYIAHFLKEKGFMKFKGPDETDLKFLSSETKAFVMDPARIYLNYQGKYPAGSVSPQQASGILDELTQAFSALCIDGKKVIRDIYRKEEIFQGVYMEQAPDLVLVANEGFNLKAALRCPGLAANGIFTGKHTQDSAFVLFNGMQKPELVPAVPCVSDIRGIIEAEIGL